MPSTTRLPLYSPAKYTPIPIVDHSLYSSMPPLDIGTNGIIKQLKNINQNKVTGPDELTDRVLKETAEQIAPIITHIFQQSYNTSKLPNDWLQALVTPIHKKSLKSDPVNYRPISLTCILCKVMEHIIVSNIWTYLQVYINNALSFTFNMAFSQDCLASLN